MSLKIVESAAYEYEGEHFMRKSHPHNPGKNTKELVFIFFQVYLFLQWDLNSGPEICIPYRVPFRSWTHTPG